MSKLVWESCRSFDRQQVEQKVRQLEEQWGVKLPAAYVEIVLNADGAMPYIRGEDGSLEIAGIRLPQGSGRENIQMMTLMPSPLFAPLTLVDIDYRRLQTTLLPPGLFPFASTGSGDSILFDYRSNKADPAVVIVFRDDEYGPDVIEEGEDRSEWDAWMAERIYPVSSSFAEFLSQFGAIPRRPVTRETPGPC